MSSPQEEARSVFESTIGGVMTEEVGAVTGELELATRLEVRYAGAGEWYTGTG